MYNNRENYLAMIKRDYPRNYTAFILFELIWGLGIPFGNTLVPAFMVVLGSSKSIIGLVTSLPALAGLLQIVTSHYFRRHPKKRWLSFSYFVSPIPWMAFSIFFFWNTHIVSNRVQLALFCVVQTIFWFISAGNEGIRFSMLTECTPLNKRGSLFGSRVVVQIIVSLAVWPMAGWVLRRWAEPQNFLASFIIASFFYTVCAFAYLLTREHRDPDIDNGSENQGLSQLTSDSIAMLKELLADRHFRFFLIISSLFYCSVAMGSFIVVYAKEQMNMSGSVIIYFTILQMLGGALATHILGKLADRIGYKKIGAISTIPLACGFLIAAVYADTSGGHRLAIFVCFFLCASMASVSRMVVMNLSIELRPRQNIGMLLSISSALMSPVMLIGVSLGGWVVDLMGTYVPLFLAGGVGAIVAGLGFVFCVHEPRKHHIQ
jgi:MFS family permease